MSAPVTGPASPAAPVVPSVIPAPTGAVAAPITPGTTLSPYDATVQKLELIPYTDQSGKTFTNPATGQPYTVGYYYERGLMICQFLRAGEGLLSSVYTLLENDKGFEKFKPFYVIFGETVVNMHASIKKEMDTIYHDVGIPPQQKESLAVGPAFKKNIEPMSNASTSNVSEILHTSSHQTLTDFTGLVGNIHVSHGCSRGFLSTSGRCSSRNDDDVARAPHRFRERRKRLLSRT